MKKEQVSQKFQNTFQAMLAAAMYPGIRLFARDVNLAPGLAKQYKPGMIIREKGFTDASCRFGGTLGSHS